MRRLIVMAALAALPWTMTVETTGPSMTPAAAIAAEDAPAAPAVPKVDIDVTKTDRHEVWLSPTVLAVGGGVLLLLIVLLLAGRGGGTTVIREK